jgi:hypothetical protein
MTGIRSRAGAAFLWGAFVLLLPVSGVAATSFSLGERYSSFENDRSGEKGSQFYTPVALSGESDAGFFGGLTSGYVVSTYRPQAGAEDVTVSTFVDTKLSLSYTAALARGCVRLGSTFNLPTGTSALPDEERGAEMDREYAELVDVSNFGEGTNANPGFAFTLPLGDFTIGLGASYHLKGPYDPTADVANDNVDPGDEALGKLTVRWEGTHANISAGIKYQVIGADKVGGEVAYKEGNMLSANAKLEYTPKPWLLFVEGAFNTWDKSRSLSGAGNLPVEEFTRYGDDFLVKASVQYLVSSKFVLLTDAKGRWARGNDFPRDSEYYDSGRTTLEGGVGFVYQIFLGVYVSGSVAYQQVKEAADADLPEDATYTGLKGSLYLTTWFK